jgi:hypothetical protein
LVVHETAFGTVPYGTEIDVVPLSGPGDTPNYKKGRAHGTEDFVDVRALRQLKRRRKTPMFADE